MDPRPVAASGVAQALQIRILLAAGRCCGRAYGRAIEMHRIARRNFRPLLVAIAADRMCRSHLPRRRAAPPRRQRLPLIHTPDSGGLGRPSIPTRGSRHTSGTRSRPSKRIIPTHCGLQNGLDRSPDIRISGTLCTTPERWRCCRAASSVALAGHSFPQDDRHRSLG